MNYTAKFLLVIFISIFFVSCQNQLVVRTVELKIKILEPVRWEYNMLSGAGTYCETVIAVEVVTPDILRGRKLNLVLQEGLARDRDDWLTEGTIWKDVGSVISLVASQKEIDENTIHWRGNAKPE